MTIENFLETLTFQRVLIGSLLGLSDLSSLGLGSLNLAQNKS